MVKKGFLKKCFLVKGPGLAGWVMGNLFQECWQHSSAETGRLRGLMDVGRFLYPAVLPTPFVMMGK